MQCSQKGWGFDWSRSAEEEDESGMLQWWCSTHAMLLWLVYWSQKRRSKPDRQTSFRLLQAIVGKTVSCREACEMLHLPPPLVICSCETHAGETCRPMATHASVLANQPAVKDDNCHMLLTQLLCYSMSDSGCEHLAAKLSLLVNTIAASMHASVHDWCVQDWHSLPGAAKCRDVTQACSSLHVDDAAGYRFVEKDLSLLRESCRQSFLSGKHEALALAIDGGRFRKPAQEYLLALGARTTSNIGCFLVPMVRLCLFSCCLSVALFHVAQSCNTLCSLNHSNMLLGRSALVIAFVWTGHDM
eukprot:6459592-Amphidinium_carterae.1